MYLCQPVATIVFVRASSDLGVYVRDWLPQLYLCEHRLTLGYTCVILQVETELKAELQKQCRAISQSEEFSKIQFQWILPPESPESASSAVNMVCNGEAFHCGSARYECFHAPLGSDMGDAQ